MKLSVHLVHQGRYVKAGDPLPADFDLPPHLEAFVVDDDPPQASRAGLRFSTVGRQGGLGTETRLAKPAAKDYPEGEEEFTPRPKWARKGKL